MNENSVAKVARSIWHFDAKIDRLYYSKLKGTNGTHEPLSLSYLAAEKVKEQLVVVSYVNFVKSNFAGNNCLLNSMVFRGQMPAEFDSQYRKIFRMTEQNILSLVHKVI